MKRSMVFFLLALGWGIAAQQAVAPGERIVRMNPDEFRKGASEQAMKRWQGPLTEAAFALLENASDPQYRIGTDAELVAGAPSVIAPYARLRDTPTPEIRPWLHWTGHFTQDQLDSYQALIGYCPFCNSRSLTIRFDPKNPERAQTSCCRKELYRNHAPENYDLKPDAVAEFRYLDDSIRRIPCKLYRDAKGRTWQIFAQNLFNMRDWQEYQGKLRRLDVLYQRTGNPLYPYKAAVILDRIAEIYHALPLALNNLNPAGKDGLGLSRAEWEALPRPNIWAEMPKIGWWNRNNPTFARGWMALGREGEAVYEYALFRHHPAFRFYSRKRYGAPDRLDQRIRLLLAREINLGYTAVSMTGLTQNYQAANNVHMLASAMLGGDRALLEFAAGSHDCIVYNHHYADGLNGEGSVHYQGMLRRQFYPYMNEKDGWSSIDPGFLANNPFFQTATRESGRQITARGLLFEHGDIYQVIHETPNDRVLGNIDTAEKPKAANLPSRIWPSWGIGVIRVGAPGERLETVLNFSRPSGHGGLMMGVAGWFDGVPVLRPHGYACPWSNITSRTVDEINRMNFPRKAIDVPMAKPSVHESWNRLLAQSAIGQNTVTVDEIASVKRGLSEPLLFKGGEKAGSPEAKFQVLEVNTIGEFKKLGVDDVSRYRRALVGVETESGRAYALDLVTLTGGRAQTVYYSVWGDRTGEQGLGEAVEKARLTDALFAGKLPARTARFSPVIWYNWVYGIYDHVTKIQVRPAQSQPWAVDFKADYYAYCRDGNGAEFGRPRPGFGVVHFRIAGAPAEPYAVWQGKAPWSPLSAAQQIRGGSTVRNQTITFDEAMEILALRRESADGKSLDSVFATLLEGRHPGREKVVSGMEVLASGAARAIRVALAEGGTDLVFYQPENNVVKIAGIETDARFALVRYDARRQVRRLDLVCGTFLRADGKTLSLSAAADTGTIVAIRGDMTGEPTRSELTIRPDGAWDPDAVKNRLLLLRQTRSGSFSNNEGYTVESARRNPDGTIAVSLAGPAPWIISWHQAWFDGGRIRVNRPIQKFAGLDYYAGTQMTFPRIGRTFTIREAAQNALSGDSDLRQAGVRDGDWFFISAIAPGQRVQVPQSATKIF